MASSYTGLSKGSSNPRFPSSHKLLPPLITNDVQRFIPAHRSRESIDLNSPPLTPPPKVRRWFLNLTWELQYPSQSRSQHYESFSIAGTLLTGGKILLAAFVASAMLYTTLRILQWTHRVPNADKIMNHFRLDPSAEPTLEVLLGRSPHYRIPKISNLPDLAKDGAFRPFAVRPSDQGSSNDITACMSLTEGDLPLIPSWLDTWNGPVSLVLTTPHSPSSQQYVDLISNVQVICQEHEKVSRHLSLHILSSTESQLHNARLNMARLLSGTQRVLLISDTSPPMPMRKIQDEVDFFGNNHVAFVRSRFLILPRNDTRWCPERYFSPASDDALECFWVFWLHYGRTQSGASLSLDDQTSLEPLALLPDLPAIELRLRSRFRDESCISAAREQSALGSWTNRKEGTQSWWIEKLCGQVLRTWEKNLL